MQWTTKDGHFFMHHKTLGSIYVRKVLQKNAFCQKRTFTLGRVIQRVLPQYAGFREQHICSYLLVWTAGLKFGKFTMSVDACEHITGIAKLLETSISIILESNFYLQVRQFNILLNLSFLRGYSVGGRSSCM